MCVDEKRKKMKKLFLVSLEFLSKFSKILIGKIRSGKKWAKLNGPDENERPMTVQKVLGGHGGGRSKFKAIWVKVDGR